MRKRIGSYLDNGAAEFCIWAPEAKTVEIILKSNRVSLQKDELGYWGGRSETSKAGDTYMVHIDNDKWPDPASNYQPEGVHGPSQIVDHLSYNWNDAEWKGMSMEDMIIYELHTGTFTQEGTFASMITKIPYLIDLGINAIEIMPLSQFPGDRNWGYDGVYPFAVQNSYGGPEGLKKLVDACHHSGIAVIIDAVYNHFGPEGSYHDKFGPYHTDRYNTPWGSAINFDDKHSDEVRNYFIQNALMWFRDYHVDALRLDAIHACKDMGSLHFVKELTIAVKELEKETGRKHILIGECDLNDPKYINPVSEGGYGLDGQWCDEFHHALRSLVTGDVDGYYEDFGTLEHMRRAFQDTFVYSGQYSAHRKKTFGTLPEKNPHSQFVVFCQNHDQVGNRLLGDRISTLVSFEALKIMAGSVLLSASVPMLFMGEEFAEDAPFQYFISHSDEALIKGIREGRKKEFSYFNFQGEAPDPYDEESFKKSKLNWNFREVHHKATLLEFYKKLIRFRKEHPAYKNRARNAQRIQIDELQNLVKIEKFLEVDGEPELLIILNYKQEDATFSIHAGNNWNLYLDSADSKWGGPGKTAPDIVSIGNSVTIKGHSILIYTRSN